MKNQPMTIRRCPDMRPRLAVFLLVGLALLVLSSSASACPTCKQALAQNDEAHQAMVSGYFYSILFMMSMPFVIIGTFGSMAWVAIRRADQGRGRETVSQPADGSTREGLPPAADR